jgi:hypothetical protein
MYPTLHGVVLQKAISVSLPPSGTTWFSRVPSIGSGAPRGLNQILGTGVPAV